MTTFVGFRPSGTSDEEALYKVAGRLLVQGNPLVQNPTSMQVVQRAAGANMSVDIGIGDVLIPNTAGTYSYQAWQTAVTNLPVTAANPSNPRIDVIVAYVNLAVVGATDNPGALAFMDVTGTPGASPVAPNSTTIQAAVGAGVPWVQLADVTVPTSATQIVTANIADARIPWAVRANLWGGTNNTNGHTVPNVTDDTVLLANAAQTINNKTFGSGNAFLWDGWQPFTSRGITFIYNANNGNKEFVLTPSDDPTGFLSVGMKIKLTRGTAPPTQSMGFVAASSQYATNASPAGMTDTGTFTYEAWVFLNSYVIGAAMSRDSAGASGGCGLQFTATGQAQLFWRNASGFSLGQSYQSVPLKRWVHVAVAATNIGAPAVSIYINGASVTTNMTSSAATTRLQSGPLQVGGSNSSTFFDGFIAEARYWSTAQSQANIQANMGISIAAQTNLVAAYPGNGTFADVSGNGNTLTANGGAIATQANNPYNTVEYGIVEKVTSSAVTVFTGTDYSIPNMTLSAAAYSTERLPFGFPANDDRWKILAYDIAGTTTATLGNNLVTAGINVPINGITFANSGSAGGNVIMKQTGTEKICYGNTGSVTTGTGAAGTQYTITMPTNFFSAFGTMVWATTVVGSDARTYIVGIAVGINTSTFAAINTAGINASTSVGFTLTGS